MRLRKGDKERLPTLVPPVTMLNYELLHRAPYNPNEMTAEEREALRASVLQHGMVESLVVQRRSRKLGLDYVIVGGHQRLEAYQAVRAERDAEDRGSGEVPCVVLDIDDDQAMRLNVALNRISGTPDPYKLGQIFADMLPRMTTQDVLATGFQQDELKQLVQMTLPPDEQARLLEQGAGDLSGFAKSITLSVEFDTVKDRDAAKDMLRALAEARGKKAGKVVLDLLKSAGAGRRGKTAA